MMQYIFKKDLFNFINATVFSAIFFSDHVMRFDKKVKNNNIVLKINMQQLFFRIIRHIVGLNICFYKAGFFLN